MVIIKVVCPSCGEIDLKPQDIHLQVSAGHGRDVYRFRCPTCRDEIEKPADLRVVHLLISGGVQQEAVRESPAVGPEFTWDDVLAFYLLLESEDYLVSLVQAVEA